MALSSKQANVRCSVEEVAAMFNNRGLPSSATNNTAGDDSKDFQCSKCYVKTQVPVCMLEYKNILLMRVC